MGNVIQRNLIWSDIRHLEVIIDLAEQFGLRGHPFVNTLYTIKHKYEQDLIDNESESS